MAKNKKSKIVAMALCASVMTGIYAAPVMAAELWQNDKGTYVTETSDKAVSQIKDISGLDSITVGGNVVNAQGLNAGSRDTFKVGQINVSGRNMSNVGYISGSTLNFKTLNMGVNGNDTLAQITSDKVRAYNTAIDAKTGALTGAIGSNIAGVEFDEDRVNFDGKHFNNVGRISAEGYLIGSGAETALTTHRLRLGSGEGQELTATKLATINDVITESGSVESQGDVTSTDGKNTYSLNEAATTADRAEGKADAAQETADRAEGKADNAQKTADAALNKAQDAQKTADAALDKAQDAQKTADAALDKAQDAQGTADAALDKAQDAQGTADAALDKAQDAQKTADRAESKADAAQETADRAEGKADNAQKTADAALDKAQDAQSTADRAWDKAESAQSTADQALKKAEGGQATADAALDKAQDAQSTADQALGKAETAQSTADRAWNKAESAQSTADRAWNKAESAQSTADMANTKADRNTAAIGDVSILDPEIAGDSNNDGQNDVVGAVNNEAQIRRDEINRVDGRINNLENRVGELEDRIDKVGAMAAAIANLRTMGYDPAAPTEVAVGIGQYRDETGAALGLFHYPNRDFMLSLSVSTSGDEVMGGIGATWKFGRKSPEKVAEIKKAQAEADARRAEEAKLAKAEEMKQAAKEAKIKAQQERHAKLAAELAAQAEAAK